MISEKEVLKIKQRLISHIESTFPEENKISAISQINEMNSEQLENFLERNKIIKKENSSEKGNLEEKVNCIFCLIASGEIKSVKIGENANAIAVLDINPISKGHALIIPKEHENKSGKGAMQLAEQISKKIKKKFSPKDVEISKSKLFGHETISILPIYSNENLNSEKRHATLEELEIIKEELEIIPEKIKTLKKLKTEKIIEKLWLPKRIP